jgi:hypothetical protein
MPPWRDEMTSSRRAIGTQAASPAPDQVRLKLDDGSQTTTYVVRYPLATTRLRVRRIPGLMPLQVWCTESGVDEALVGGFYVRRRDAPPAPRLTGSPLGELWIDGTAQPFVPFSAPWDRHRACISVSGDEVRIARRDELPRQPPGDLLQAGPLLVRNGQVIGGDEEGFSASASQFDSDITEGRHPRAALGYDGDCLIAVVCEGRASDEAGLTIGELARAMVEFGAREALNLDGGGSTSLVCAGRLRNIPREAHEVPVPGGRAIATALEFARP